MTGLLNADNDTLALFFTDDVYLAKGDRTPLSELKKEQPVFAPAADQKVADTVVRSFKSLGKNKRKILILVNDPVHDVSDEKGRELLRKIVKSVNLTAEDFALVNYASCQDATLQEFISYFSSTTIFSFGVSPSQLQIDPVGQNSITTIAGVRLIFSMVLHELNKDFNIKKALWACLQKLGL